MSVLFTKRASDALMAWLQQYLPPIIGEVGGELQAAVPFISSAESTPEAYATATDSTLTPITLDAIRHWSDHATVANVETPALYVLPQTSGARTNNQTATLDETHEFDVCVEVGDPDQGIAHTKCMCYVAAIIRAVIAWAQGAAPFPNSGQILLGQEGNAQIVRWGLTPSTTTPSGLYEFATVAVTVFLSELP